MLLLLLITRPLLYAAGNGDSIYVVKDLEIEAFIKDILKPILKNINADVNNINIYLVDDPTPNAFVYAGNNMFVHTGLLAIIDDYNELAGVLTHELGHITAGHALKTEQVFSKANILVLLGLASLLVGLPLAAQADNGNGDLMEVIGFLSYSALQGTKNAFLYHSRTEEAEADQLAAQYLSNSPYNLQGFVTFMEKLYNKEDKIWQQIPKYAMQTTHPATLSRINYFNSYISAHKKSYTKNKQLQLRLDIIKAKIFAFNNMGTYNKNNIIVINYIKAIQNYMNKNYNVASILTQKLINSKPDYIYFKELMGDIYLENKQYVKATNIYLEVVDKVVDKNLLYLKIAQTYLGKKEYQKALNNIDISLQLEKNNPFAFYIKSLILGKMHLYANADIMLAEYYFLLHDYNKSLYFAHRGLYKGVDKNYQQQAQDIISIINHQNFK